MSLVRRTIAQKCSTIRPMEILNELLSELTLLFKKPNPGRRTEMINKLELYLLNSSNILVETHLK